MVLSEKKLENLRRRQSVLIEGMLQQKKILAENIMISPTYLSEEDTIETILYKLQKEDVNYCIVVDKEQKFIGEITDEMLLKIIAHTSIHEPLVKILDIGYKRSINYTKTRDYVKKHNNVVYKKTPFFEIMKLIDKKGFQFIPVINDESKVVGLITPSSILRFIVNR